MRAVVYDFTDSCSGEHARAFLGDWRGSLVCDDYAGYMARFALGMTEGEFIAHARRKFVELPLTNNSTIAGTAIDFMGRSYSLEREVKEMAPWARTACCSASCFEHIPKTGSGPTSTFPDA